MKMIGYPFLSVCLLVLSVTAKRVDQNGGGFSGLNVLKDKLELVDNLSEETILQQNVKQCTSNYECLHGGSCAENGTCICPEGTTGFLCEDVLECIQNPGMCGNGTDVECVFDPEYKTAECVCNDKKKWFNGFKKKCGRPCRRSPDDCGKYGRCSPNTAFCWCVKGVSGDRCEIIDQCESGEVDCGNDPSATCTLGLDGAYCKCSKPYQIFDEQNRICKGEPCTSNSDCFYGGNCTVSGTCRCPQGTEGPLCQEVVECIENPDKCGNGTDVTCVFDPEYETVECACVDKKKGFDDFNKRCAKPCSSSPDSCGKYGRCSDSTAFCWCVDGVSSDRCEIIDQCASGEVDCGDDPSATCSLGIDGAYCKCALPNQVFDKENKICKNESCTSNSDCFYGANCTADGTCRCPQGPDGLFCQQAAECIENPDVCGNSTDARCVIDEEYETVECACVDKKKWFNDYQKRCARPCTRLPDSCGKYGRCSTSTAFCSCIEGVSGDRCEIIDQCASGEIDCGDDPSVTCTLGINGAYCKCGKAHQVFDEIDKTCKG